MCVDDISYIFKCEHTRCTKLQYKSLEKVFEEKIGNRAHVYSKRDGGKCVNNTLLQYYSVLFFIFANVYVVWGFYLNTLVI